MNAKGLRLAGLAAAALALVACGDREEDAEAPDAAAPAAGAAPDADSDSAERGAENRAESERLLAENADRAGVRATDSGLQYEILEEGPSGAPSPGPTDIVTVHYVGTLIDGVEFDSSRARGAAARFPLDRVIPGWTEGVQLMSVGDRYRFYVPSELAYGDRGTPGGPIGPNQALIFDVELLKVANPERSAAESAAFLEENAKKSGVRRTASGLQYEVLAEGEAGGASPKDSDIVRMHYEGRLVDGTVFDSSHARGEPVEFPPAEAIAGLTEGLQLMSAGDKYRFAIPPSLAFGEQGTPDFTIAPNEAVIYEVELLGVRRAGEPAE